MDEFVREQHNLNLVQIAPPEKIFSTARNAVVAGRKDDRLKNQLALVDPEFVEGVGAVLTFGASKYQPYNWQKGISYHRVFSACLRHLYAWWKGERNDPETGLSHLYHAACNLMFLAHYDNHKERFKEFDDRYYKN